MDSTWSHDLYEDDFVGKRIDYDAGGTKVIISNLDFGVTDSDLEVSTPYADSIRISLLFKNKVN